MGSKHATCNTEPECQPDEDTEAPVAADGVQPTFIRVPEEHKHTAPGSGAMWHGVYLWEQGLLSLLKPFW